jgi:uncharacterized protein YjbJ (UPF0337 family)
VLVGSEMVENVKNAVGMIEETIGNVTGLESLQASGQKSQAEGQVEDKQVRTQGYADAVDYATGTLENIAGSVIVGWNPLVSTHASSCR